MDAKHEHEVLVAKCAQPLALYRGRHCPLEEIIDIEADGVELRQNSPLDFEQVSSASAVKRVLVSRFEVGALCGLSQAQARFVSQICQGCLDPRKIRSANQKVEVRELA